MEKKYFLKTGKEVKIGDEVIITFSDVKENSSYSYKSSYTITKDNIQVFIDMGIITVVNDVDEDYDYTTAIAKVAVKLGWDSEDIIHMAKNYTQAVFSMLIKEVAIALDKKYPDHISKEPIVYIISVINGDIVPVYKEDIINYNNFAAFRSVVDAKKAKIILKPFIDKMFNGCNCK